MLTSKSRYAVTAVIELAVTSSNRHPTKLSDIAAKQNISLNYLKQIFRKLKKANLVHLIPGSGGSYNLNLSLEQISIENIIDAVEENLNMTRCAKDQNCIKKTGVYCSTHTLWKGLSNHIRSYFSNISIADIVSGKVSTSY